MVELNKNLQRRFGWYRSKPGAKMDMHVVAQPLDEDCWKEFEKYTKGVSDFRPYLIDYLALKADFAAISSVKAKLGQSISAVFEARLISIPESIEAQTEVQRLLTNFLGTASAFRDRSRTRLSARFGKQSIESLAFKAKTSELFDRSYAYRVLYHLRNHAQHHENPISVVPINATLDAQGKMIAEVTLQLDPRRLAANGNINAKVREEINAKGSDLIELLPAISEFLSAHDELMLALIEMHLLGIVEMAEYASAVCRKFGIPTDVVEVVWEGTDPKGGPQSQMRCFPFGMDELKTILTLAATLRGRHSENSVSW